MRSGFLTSYESLYLQRHHLVGGYRSQYLRSRVPGVPCRLRGEVGVTVVHADRVYLLFVTFDAVGRANVVSEDPGLCWGLGTSEGVCSTTCVQIGADLR